MRRFIELVKASAGVGMSVALLTACSSGGSGVAPEHPDITGPWVVNLELSDKPGDQMPRQPPQGAPSGRPGGRPGGGGDRQARMQTGLAILLQNSVAFRIEEADSIIILTGAEGLVRKFLPDGQEREQRFEGLGNVVMKSRWKGDKLVVERTLEGGAKITEEFELSEDGRQLIVDMKISGVPRGIEFRRVYDAGIEGL